MRDKIIWLGGQGENRNGFTFRTRAWRVAPCRRLRRILKNHTKCVPSHLILRMKNSESEESLAGWLYTILRSTSFPPGCINVHHSDITSPQHPIFELRT